MLTHKNKLVQLKSTWIFNFNSKFLKEAMLQLTISLTKHEIDALQVFSVVCCCLFLFVDICTYTYIYIYILC